MGNLLKSTPSNCILSVTVYPNLTVLQPAKKYCLAIQDRFIARSTCSTAILDLTDPVRLSSTASLTSSTEKVEHHRSHRKGSTTSSRPSTILLAYHSCLFPTS